MVKLQFITRVCHLVMIKRTKVEWLSPPHMRCSWSDALIRHDVDFRLRLHHVTLSSFVLPPSDWQAKPCPTGTLWDVFLTATPLLYLSRSLRQSVRCAVATDITSSACKNVIHVRAVVRHGAVASAARTTVPAGVCQLHRPRVDVCCYLRRPRFVATAPRGMQRRKTFDVFAGRRTRSSYEATSD